MRLLVVLAALSGLASIAQAQDVAHAAVAPGDEGFEAWPPREATTLAALCEGAARTEWATSVARDRGLVCVRDADVRPGLAAIHVRHPNGEILALAWTQGSALRIVAGLEEVHGPESTVSLTRTSETTAGGWPFVSFEVHTEGEEGGSPTSRDDLVTCLHRPDRFDTMACVERTGLRVVAAGTDAEATATINPSGALAVTRVRGPWRVLQDELGRRIDFDAPTLVPIPSRLPDVSPGRTDYLLPLLYVDQWRRARVSPSSEVRRVEAEAAASDGSHGPNDHEPARSLDALCARAATWLEATNDYAICRLFTTDDPGLFVVEVEDWMSDDTYVAVGDPDHLRVVTRIGHVWTGPTRSGTTRLVRLHQRALAHERAMLLETETTLHDNDLGYLEAYGFVARHMTACAHDGDVRTLHCGAHVPLAYEPYTWAFRATVVPVSFPYVWRETAHSASHAVLALRPDGVMRVTLRDGDWDHLAEDDEHNPLPLAIRADAERVVLVPMFPTD